ncbi:MAG: peptidylprolyl isomerase [Chitinophagales bacterium]|nr:peptidylprolyl isomerase [Chitinophagales bacterium]
MKRLFVILAVMMSLGLQAQVKKVVADKIVAQVGDKFILKSDIINAIADFKRQTQGQEGVIIPTECQVLEGQLIRKALYLQAQKDSLKVSEEEIEAQLDNRIRSFIGAYGSKETLEEIAGKTVYQIKDDFREPLKEKELSEQMERKIVENIKITPNEVKAYYERIPKDSLAFYESELEISQLVLIPKPNKDVEEYVSKQLYDLRRQVEFGGKKFEQLAKLYSEDPGSRDNGGQYSLNRNERNWDPAFLSASFRLKDGQISPVIKSKFGLHIIQLVARQGDDAVVRHILKIPPVTEDEIKESIDKLDSLRKQILDNKISFGEAVNKFSDDDNSKFNAGALTGRDGSTMVNIDQLDADMVTAIKAMKPGEISKPRLYTDERQRKAVRIIYLKTRTEPHRENLKEDYNRIAQRALEEKKQAAIEKWFREKIPTFYVSIDKEYTTCKEVTLWSKTAQGFTGNQ